MTLPNFLIVGAAKSGTTSLYHYLSQHPEVFMSPVKEPKFITAQFINFPLKGPGDEEAEKRIIKNLDDYKNLFNNVCKEKAVGEASVDNLYFFDGAIRQIKKYFGNIRIIIILRNPVERAYSQYIMFKNFQREFLSFEEALEAEEERKRNNWAFFWYYKDLSFYSDAVKAYLANFDQVRIFIYDDLMNDSMRIIKAMYEFLEVDTSFSPNLNIRYNISGFPRMKYLYNFIFGQNLIKRHIIKPFLSVFINDAQKKNLLERSKTLLLKKPQMNLSTRSYLNHIFKEDILKLQDLINRDISSWLK